MPASRQEIDFSPGNTSTGYPKRLSAGHPWAITQELDVYLMAAPSGHLEAWHAPRAGRPTEERDAMARLARLLFERDVLSRSDVDRFLLAVESSFMILPA
jgi:hypothetical protein